MKVRFRITQRLLSAIHDDLSRPHAFAAERVGFVACAASHLDGDGLLLLAQTYQPVEDDHYLNDPTVGALMGSAAIRNALQLAYTQPISMFHIHRHEHHGWPQFSSVDLRESARFVPDFWKVQPHHPHGALVLSQDSIAGLCWIRGHKTPVRIAEFTVVGRPTTVTDTAA